MTLTPMNVLLLGSGGREHAIAAALAQSELCERLFIAPGNAGTAAVGENIEGLDICDGGAVVACAQERECSLVVIGPEAPLVAGVADAVREAGISCFGPGAAGARLEGSKDFSKQFMLRHGLPTAAYAAFTDCDAALAYLVEQPVPIVVKADGLAAGKGVTVAATREQAQDAVRECFSGRFGEAGATVVIEECLSGAECSMLAFVSGPHAVCMPEAQDHKRAFDGDEGPNTGGMGVYSPVPAVTPAQRDEMQSIMARAAAGLVEEGIDYCGVLYGGFMLTQEGPKLLEFNVRFGDPETQVLLPRLQSDLVYTMLGMEVERPLAAQLGARLEDPYWAELSWSDEAAVSVVLASGGYPGAYEKGRPISGIAEAEAMEGVRVYHAGTCEGDDGRVLTNGGRVLNVTATAPTFAEAREKAYAACEKISWEGMFYRRDIGARALARG